MIINEHLSYSETQKQVLKLGIEIGYTHHGNELWIGYDKNYNYINFLLEFNKDLKFTMIHLNNSISKELEQLVEQRKDEIYYP